MYARQPPNVEMSRAPAIASASTRNPLTVRPSASRSVPIASGGGHRRNEPAERRRRQCPDLDLDRAALARADPQQAGPRRLGGERKQPIVLRGRAASISARPAPQFAVERHAGQMRADHGERDFARGRRRRQRRERRLCQAERTERQRGIGVEDAAERGRERILPGRARAA